MKRAALFIFLLTLSGCKSAYIDQDRTGILPLNFGAFVLNTANNDFNVVTTLSRKSVKVDNEIVQRRNFKVNIPKKLVNWEVHDNEFIFEYDDRQVIVIDAGYEDNTKLKGRWENGEVDEDLIYKYLYRYFHKKDWIMETRKRGTVTTIYTNGEVTILLFNIKSENLASFGKLLQSFEQQD